MAVSIDDRQTDVTSYEITLAGQPFEPSEGLISVTIERSVNRIASARLILLDNDAGEDEFPLSNQDNLKPGSELEIKSGYHDETVTVFKGVIVQQQLKLKEGRSLLIIDCKDKAVQLSLIRKSAYYVDMKDSDIWQSLANAAGVTVEADATNVTHKQLVQYNCTDWDFIVSRAEMNGMLVSTVDGAINIKKPAAASGLPVLTGTYGDNLYEFEASMDARTQVKTVKAVGWNDADQVLAEGASEEPSFAANGNMPGTDLADAVKADTFSIWHSGAIADDELKDTANAALLKSRLGRMQGRLRVQGSELANPGDLIAIEGVGDRFKGNVIATGVRHEIVRGNWLTDIQFGNNTEWFSSQPDVSAAPAAAMVPHINGLQIGIVTDLEDPLSASRIKIKIPTLDNNEEGIWARQSTIDAGNDRGMIFRPEVGDEVIVGFIAGDPRYPIVLGALHSGKNAAPIEAKNDNHEKGWTTRSGMKLIFNDDKKTINIETPGGNKCIISEEDKKITIEDLNGNKIVTSPDGINIESAKDIILKATGDIKMEGINIEAKGSASFKAEGSGQSTLQSSGTTVVKGSLVQIN
jgi:Rhs element Vgr protein